MFSPQLYTNICTYQDFSFERTCDIMEIYLRLIFCLWLRCCSRHCCPHSVRNLRASRTYKHTVTAYIFAAKKAPTSPKNMDPLELTSKIFRFLSRPLSDKRLCLFSRCQHLLDSSGVGVMSGNAPQLSCIICLPSARVRVTAHIRRVSAA